MKMAKNATFSQKPYVKRLRAVINTMQSLSRTHWLITQAEVRAKLAYAKADHKSVERAIKDLVQLGVLKEVDEKRCKYCGRPLGKGPFYSLSKLIPFDITTPTKTYGPMARSNHGDVS
jgi:hypothetical protein